MLNRKWNKVTVTKMDGTPVPTGAASPGLRRAVFRRDGQKCRYCGHTGPTAHFEVDHVVPRSRGGATSYANLVIACWPCNQLKGASTWRPGQPPWDREDFDQARWRRLLRTARTHYRRGPKPKRPLREESDDLLLDLLMGD